MYNPDYDLFLTLLKRIPDLDMEYAMGNIGGSPQLYEQILSKVIRMFNSNIAEMERALNAEELPAFGVRAHGMKGSFNQVGCLRIAKLAEALEQAAKGDDLGYCRAYYGNYKREATRFYEQADAALRRAGMCRDKDAVNRPAGDIAEFADLLSSCKTAAAGFDAPTASKCLIPLTGYRFGKDVDSLVARAMEEIEAFRPKKALPFIAELLDICKKRGGQYEC